MPIPKDEFQTIDEDGPVATLKGGVHVASVQGAVTDEVAECVTTASSLTLTRPRGQS